MGALLIVIVFSMAACPSLVMRHYEPKFLTTGPNGPETPQSVGIPYERLRISSGDRTLDGYLVQAPQACQQHVAVLVFHGVMETISDWVKAQRFLYDHCVSSLVFDYSGHGDSSRPGTVKNLHQDALAAYSYFASRFANRARLCVLGHSMGNGPLLETLPSYEPAPSCVIVANAFSSMLDFGKAHSRIPGILLYMMPDIWNNVKNVSHNRVPLLVVHSDADSVIPVEMGQRIFDAALEPKKMVVLHGFKHNALHQDPVEQWWMPVLQFMEEK
jgi:alpha-beta hydrolase superfamily lysophospholipase